MNNEFFIKIKKKIKLYKILSLISIIFQFIFYVIQDLLDLYYTNDQEKKKIINKFNIHFFNYNFKCFCFNYYI